MLRKLKSLAEKASYEQRPHGMSYKVIGLIPFFLRWFLLFLCALCASVVKNTVQAALAEIGL